ncbi:zinc metalloproteinase nas-4-like isoform X1 [Paramacrobiotus metropolitanus]|uniref:zinc metalloproteinase nas-4-like isoform X1 n=1 Tax=Paramacrobiotus metropolitanus TaxID=2943436 RepID=UPI002445899A|nr:zinc metalloproteinase nas-4-like isoform X1 [Paramacrobiotus metropolitanus]
MILSRSLTTKKKSEILLFAAVAGVCTQIAIAVSDENGDISITPDLFEAPVNSSSKRDTSETGPRLWPSRTAIPYYISSDFEKSQREVILKALLKIERMTKGCIAFKVRQYEFDYIYFIPSYSGRCSSDVGRTGGYQYIYLAVATIDYPYLCLDTAAIQTRVLHALGFDHEQKRADRDQFVDVRSDNIKSGFAHEYQINASVHTLGTKYDYHSITHYGPFSGAIVDSSPVMVSKKGLIVRMGQRQRLSPTDVAKIMLAYNCPVNTGPGHKSSNTTEEFPRFPLEIMTEDECAAQFNRYCKSDVSTTVNCTYRNDFRIVCQSNSSVAVLQRMTVDMAEAPLRIVSIDVEEQLIAKYPFLPVQQQVLKL